MKRILISILTLGVVAVIGTYVTKAYFTDTETSTGNVLAAGTIDISVDNQNPWNETFSSDLNDLKPSYVRFIEFKVQNEGNNPLKLYKRLKNYETADGTVSEPECTLGGGTWNETSCEGDYVANNDIDSVIEYDMYLGDDNMHVVWDDTEHTTGHVEGYNSIVVHEDEKITLKDIENLYIYLTQLPANGSVKVIQSYHMATDTDNWAQGDTLTFDIELLAQQVNDLGPETTTVMLNNKDTSYNEIYDGRWGILSYLTSNSTFDYDFVGKGLDPSTNYSLIYYADGWPGNHPGALIGTMTTDGSGNVSSSGSVDLGLDLPDSADANYADGAKIWLVPSSDYDTGSNSLTTWSPSDYLFEHNFVKYDDTDL